MATDFSPKAESSCGNAQRSLVLPPLLPEQPQSQLAPFRMMFCFMGTMVRTRALKLMPQWAKRSTSQRSSLSRINEDTIELEVVSQDKDKSSDSSSKSQSSYTTDSSNEEKKSEAMDLGKSKAPSPYQRGRKVTIGDKRFANERDFANSEGSSSDEEEDGHRFGVARKGRRKRRKVILRSYDVKSGNYYQTYSCIACSVGMLATGMLQGWMFPMLIHEGRDNRASLFTMKPNANALVMGACNFGVFFSAPLTGFLMDLVGRKTMLLVSAAPLMCSWVLTISTNTVVGLFFARFVAGIGYGVIVTVAPIYIGEVSEARQRGWHAGMLSVALMLGTLLNLVLMPFVPLFVCVAIGMSFSLFFFVLIFLAAPSPTFFAMRNDAARARDLLDLIRSDSPDEIADELSAMVESVWLLPREGFGFQDIQGDRVSLRAFCLLTFLTVCQQLSGIIVYETVTHCMGHLDIEMASIVFRSAQFVSTFVSMCLVDTWGRRPLLLLSFIGSATVHFGLSLNYIYVSREEEPSILFTNWLPVVLGTFYGAFYGLGMGPLVMTLISEILYPSQRGTVSCTICVIATYFNFLEMKIFHALLDVYGNITTSWVCGMWCFIGAVFVWFVIPETKGLNTNEILSLLDEENF